MVMILSRSSVSLSQAREAGPSPGCLFAKVTFLKRFFEALLFYKLHATKIAVGI